MKHVLVHVLLVNTVGFCVEKAYLATALTAVGSIWQEYKYGSALPGRDVTCKWVMGNVGPGKVGGEDEAFLDIQIYPCCHHLKECILSAIANLKVYKPFQF